MRHFATGCAFVALSVATPALAQTPTSAELAELVRQQAAEIATLRARLDRIEGQQSAAAPAPITTTVPTAQLAQQGADPALLLPQTANPQPRRTVPFAPQLAPPGPADRDVAQAEAARNNPSGRLAASRPAGRLPAHRWSGRRRRPPATRAGRRRLAR